MKRAYKHFKNLKDRFHVHLIIFSEVVLKNNKSQLVHLNIQSKTCIFFRLFKNVYLIA